MPDYFKSALNDFVQNFAWGGAIEHLLENGYTIERMINEGRVTLSRNQIEEMIGKINKQRKLEGKPEFPIK